MKRLEKIDPIFKGHVELVSKINELVDSVNFLTDRWNTVMSLEKALKLYLKKIREISEVEVEDD